MQQGDRMKAAVAIAIERVWICPSRAEMGSADESTRDDRNRYTQFKIQTDSRSLKIDNSFVPHL